MALTDISHPTDIAMLTDLYELTMAQGLWESGKANEQGCFTAFYRDHPFGSAYAVMCGTAELPELVENLRFTPEDIDYLASLEAPAGGAMFKSAFLDYLRDFRAHVNIDAVPEGELVFPREPMVRVTGPALECQLLETLMLVTFNHQTLIATKANRITRAAEGRTVLEFGSRRAQGYDGAILGARAAYIGGCQGTACVLSDRDYKIPAGGTMAHSWVQMFDSEYEAFKAYADIYPDNCVFLVDTYNVLKSGVPNAIRVAKELEAEKGIRARGIRLDSGDIAYLSIEARKMLDAAGFEDMQIMASNSLDEYLVRDLLVQGARVDSFGIGERLITSKSEPVFGGVYKLAAVKDADSDAFQPKIKLSENTEKVTNPGNKTVYRIYSKKTGKIKADLICLADEKFDPEETMVIFDPVDTWKKTKVLGGTYELRELLVPVIKDGKSVYKSPSVMELRDYCKQEQNTLWDESRRFVNPQKVYVDLSQPLYDMKKALLEEMSEKTL